MASSATASHPGTDRLRFCLITTASVFWLLQESLQQKITGALGQLSRASELLSTQPDLAGTTQLEDLLEEVIRQQNDIADKHEAWAEAVGGDATRTVRLPGITEGFKAASHRCAIHIVLRKLCYGLILRARVVGAMCPCTDAVALAVDGQEHNKELYYERTIQTLEQQLIAFQNGLNNGSPVFDMRLAEASENTPSQLEDNDDQEVAEYMKRCRCVHISSS